MAIFGFKLWKLALANAANALTISSYLESAGMPIQFQLLCWISSESPLTYGFFTLHTIHGIIVLASSSTVCFLQVASQQG